MLPVFKVGLITIWFFSPSCAQDTTGTVMTSEDSLSTYFGLTAILFPEWVAYFKNVDPEFNESIFVLKPDQTYWRTPNELPLDFSLGMTLRDSIFFEFSPDSSKFVDINRFAEIVDTEHGRRLGFDADASVWVGDISHGVTYRIDVCGTQCGFIEAKWVDDDRVLIIGHSYVNHFPDCVPFFKLYDLKRRLTIRFHAKKPYPCIQRPYITSIDRRMERMGVTR